MPTRILSLALLAALGTSLAAQDAAKTRRSHFTLSHGDAKELAAALGKHFKDDADVLAVEGNNALLVRATPAVTEEITKLIAALDKGGRMVAVELTLVETAAKAEDKADEKALTGPEKTVMERVAEMKKRGLVTGVKRFQFLAVENSPVTVTVGVSQAYTSGMMAAGGGFGRAKGAAGGPVAMTRSVSYRDLGSTVKVTARVADDKAVTLDLTLEDSTMRESKDGAVLGQDDNGVPVRAPEFVRTSFKSKLTVAPGRAVAANELETTSKSETARTFLVATARPVEPAAGGK
ncbi:MAG: secretin N-terminal domain-containing protein [Gemmataceae bacterium]